MTAVPQGPGRSSPWPSLLLILGAGVVSAFQVGKAPAALAAVRADLGLTLATASWLLSAFALVGALAGVAIGLVADRTGARRLVIGGLLLQGACSLAGGLASDAPALLTARVGEGIGFLAVTVAAPALVAAVAGAKLLPRAMAVWGTFMPVGITLAMLGAPLIAPLGWRGLWLTSAAILVGYAGLLALGTRGLSPVATPTRPLGESLRRILVARGPWLLAGLMGTFSACYFALFGFLPSMLSERLGIGPETGSLLAAAAVAVNVAGNLLCGPLLARGVPRVQILLFAFATLALSSFGIFGGGLSGPAVYGLCLLFSAVGGLIPVALIEAAPRHAPGTELVGASMGLVMQGNNAGLMLGPAAAGALAGAFGWPALAPLVAALAIVAALLALVLARQPAETAATLLQGAGRSTTVGRRLRRTLKRQG